MRVDRAMALVPVVMRYVDGLGRRETRGRAAGGKDSRLGAEIKGRVPDGTLAGRPLRSSGEVHPPPAVFPHERHNFCVDRPVAVKDGQGHVRGPAALLHART